MELMCTSFGWETPISNSANHIRVAAITGLQKNLASRKAGSIAKLTHAMVAAGKEGLACSPVDTTQTQIDIDQHKYAHYLYGDLCGNGPRHTADPEDQHLG